MDKIGVMLGILLLLVTIQSTFYFLGRLKVKMIEWIVFNACAPSNITLLIETVPKKPGTNRIIRANLIFFDQSNIGLNKPII
jgi:hypothetical protein